jgi:hypothetical protein
LVGKPNPLTKLVELTTITLIVPSPMTEKLPDTFMSKAPEGIVNGIKYSLLTVIFPFINVYPPGAGVDIGSGRGFLLQMQMPVAIGNARTTKRANNNNSFH